jgi:coatomer subunit beta
VCAAALWAISVCSESALEVSGSTEAILFLFNDLLERRDTEKELLEGTGVEDDYILPINYYGGKERDEQGKHLKPWLMEMEELLFFHIGLTLQANGSYAIASSSKSSSEDVFRFTPPLYQSDNLHFLVHSGDALLADFVEDILSKIEEKATEFPQYFLN